MASALLRHLRPAGWQWLIWLVPVLLAAHAVVFWGRGVADIEGRAFILNYLAQRPLANVIFDPALNDWGAYQARELSYLVDYLDARVFAAMLARGMLIVIPLSGVLGLALIGTTYAIGATRVWRMDRTTAALALGWFFSIVVVQASTGIFYRSAKILLSVLTLVAVVNVWSILAERRDRPVTVGGALSLVLLSVALPLADRQGVFFLVLLLAAVLFWMIAVPSANRLPRRTSVLLVAAVVAGLAFAAAYSYVIAPRLVFRLNGYWPDFSYQQFDILEGLARPDPWGEAWQMMERQASFLAGGLSAWIPGILLGLCLWRFTKHTPAPDCTRARAMLIAVGLWAILLGGLLLMVAVMILRHRPVYTVPDHSYWYYFLPAHVLVLCGVSGLIGRVAASGSRWRLGVWIALVVLTAGNVSQYPAQRAIMADSRWLRGQLADTERMLAGFDRLKTDETDFTVPRWVWAGPAGGVLRLPVDAGIFFPDSVQTALATRSGRRPLDQASGPHWPSVWSLLRRVPSPLDDPSDIPPLIEAWRQMGIREILMDPSAYDDEQTGLATLGAIRGAVDQVVGERRYGPFVAFALADAPAPFRTAGRLRPIPTSAFSLEASRGADELPFVIDGNLDTRWSTGDRQRGGEWLRLTFDRPRDIARLRLELNRETPGDYPRALRVESWRPDSSAVSYSGSGLAPLISFVLRKSLRTAVEIDFEPNTTEVLLVTQTGMTDVWFWSIHELAVWER